jgi:predicted GNAT family acetyltransferase
VHISSHTTLAAWLNRVSPLLYSAEPENNLLLGLAEQALASPSPDPSTADWRLLSVGDGKDTAGAALRTPPHNVILSRMPPAALGALADWLAEAGDELPGVVGPDELPGTFARLWVERTSVAARLRMRQRIHECRQVVWRERADGELRPAGEIDVPLLARWWVAFNIDAKTGQMADDPAAVVRRGIERQGQFVWQRHGEVVSCAALNRATRNGVAVNFVYTPPELRGRGYATSCVAELTGRALRDGRRFCCLYTDLDNPTSNAIYARIGYTRVCESEWWEFS